MREDREWGSQIRSRPRSLLRYGLLLLGIAVLAATVILITNHGRAETRSAARQPLPHGHQPIALQVVPSSRGSIFRAGAIGLSIESSELGTQDLDSEHSSLVTLMRALGPATLRVGGGSIDRAWWTSSDERPPRWATNSVTPLDLERLAGLASATGWKVILGINLAHFALRRAADEARVARRLLGSHLRGFAIGNEPDVYRLPVIGLRPSSYGAPQYLREITADIDAVRRAVPGASFFGPDLHSQEWLPALVARGKSPFSVITQHFYPTTFSIGNDGCEVTSVPTTAQLLSPAVTRNETNTAAALAEAGHLLHVPTAITETNATGSCDASGGPRTSPVFASALWSLDWSLRATRAGVGSLQFHGNFGHCDPSTASPICAPSYRAEASGEVIPRPEYYGLFAARQLEGGEFIEVKPRRGIPSVHLNSYATVHENGEISVAIINSDARLAAAVTLRIPGFRRVTGQRLLAPSVASRTGMTFAGAPLTVDEQARPAGSTFHRHRRGFRVAIPPASALILSFGRKTS